MMFAKEEGAPDDALGSGRERATAQKPAVLGHHAAILDDQDAGLREPFRRAVVADPELKPDGPGAPGKGEDLVRVPGEILGTPEDLDDIGRRWEVGQRGNGEYVEEARACELGVDGNNPVPLITKIGRDVVRRRPWIGLCPEHRDRFGLAQDLRDPGVVLDQILSPVLQTVPTLRPDAGTPRE